MAASLPVNHDHLYWDKLCRSKKGESVLSFIMATYQAKAACKRKKISPHSEECKELIAKYVTYAYELYKGDSGSYNGDMRQFQSQYTIGHELCIWKNSYLDLTDLAIKVAENKMTIRDYFDIVFLNYIQPINGHVVHILWHLLNYLKENHTEYLSKDDIDEVFMTAGHTNVRGEVNGTWHMLISTNYFMPVGKDELKYVGKCSIDELISRCNTTYVEKGYSAAQAELGTEEAYINYLLEDRRYEEADNATEEIAENDNRVVGGENILLYGVPGVGKSHMIEQEYCSNAQYMERVVFHPEYTYSDFVGQILPRVEGKILTYEFTPGPFTTILKKAYKDPSHMYYLVIEELNRGNAPAIFGEIFQLLDRNEDDLEKLGESEYAITNYEIAKEVYGNTESYVYIPSNLSIIATMNTADQNVFTLDTAFQRRWNMQHIPNDIQGAEHAEELIEGTDINWASFATVINDIISSNNTGIAVADKRLGAYFVKENELSADVFPEKVLKYLWDDALKMERDVVFNEELTSLDSVIETFEESEPDKLKKILRLEVYSRMLNSSMKE